MLKIEQQQKHCNEILTILKPSNLYIIEIQVELSSSALVRRSRKVLNFFNHTHIHLNTHTHTRT